MGAAVLSGLLTALAFPKFHLLFFAWISLIPLLALILQKKPRQSFFLGLTAGFVFYAVLLYWIPAVPRHYGGLSPVISLLIDLILVLFLALFWGIFSLVSSFIKIRFPAGIFILLPFLWTTFEYLVTHFLTGFPWGLLGYSQQPNVYFLQTAAVFGVYGLSFVLVLFQSFFLCSIILKKRSPFFSGLALVLVLHAAGFISIKKPPENQPAFTAAVIQGNVPSEINWQNIPDEDIRLLFERHVDLSRQAAAAGARIIVWPEFTVPLCFSCPYGIYSEFRQKLNELSSGSGCTLVLGTNEIQSKKDGIHYYNTSLALQPDLSFTQYNKMHLVPFGEYTPYKKIFSFINKMTHAIGEVTPGKEPHLHHFGEFSFGSPICYEIVFPNLVRHFVKKGASFLVTQTNDGWYGKSAAPYQHFSMAAFRAVENRRYLLRAATTGISGIIDPFGRVVTHTKLDTQGYLAASISPERSLTFYTRYGDLLPFLSLTLTILFLILALFKRKEER